MITVDVHRDVEGFTLTKQAVTALVKGVCRREGISNAKFSVVFVGDNSIQKIHKTYLRHNTVTDIITFSFETNLIDSELYINLQQAKRQAKQFGVTITNELRRLIIHGVLHAAGYDDTTPRERKKMFDVQERYVRELIPS
ncbi:MAG: rRNA maturation RNase YbeY [Bacteroidota bacterium]